MTDSIEDPASPVEPLLKGQLDLLDYLLEQGEVSFASALESTIPKVGLLAAASALEAKVQRILQEFFLEATHTHPHAAEFVRIAALERKYHTLFDWSKSNANKFFSLFGKDMREYVTGKLRKDESLATRIAAFIELGELRNQLVHGNYAQFTLSKTTAEVLVLFRTANAFVDQLPALLRMSEE